MIHTLYELTRKGWLKALSFILSTAMFATILLKSSLFAQHFGGSTPYLAILVFYAMAILWIHGIGFEIRSAVWKAIFLPLLGYLLLIPSISYLLWL